MKKTKKVIVVRCQTPIAKPTNTSIQKTSAMLLLGHLKYKNGTKDFNTKMYLLKGVRGMLRHAGMKLAKTCNMEVCHSSEKEALQDGTQLIPKGFHALGSCDPMNPCILRGIFGTFREESRIKASSDPLASIKHKEYTTEFPIQNVHIATEHRIALSFEGTPIQDFKQVYFAGTFTFQIDVSKLNEDEIKFLMESILYIDQLGGGKNTGYGQVTVLDFEYQELVIVRKAVKNGDKKFEITEEITTTQIDIDNIESWRSKYLYKNEPSNSSEAE
jgi:hypothetical protein